MTDYKCQKCGGELTEHEGYGSIFNPEWWYVCQSCQSSYSSAEYLRGWWTRDAEEAEKRCANCEHYQHGRRDIGECGHSWPDEYGDAGYNNVSLIPPPDFRCKFWQAK
uniref:Uncharacterized protein n=1 Tax=viral metagenome TaxID=1070528 RepID=A0A6M3KCL5_9ZZZZ